MVYIAGLLALFIVFAVQTGTRYVLNEWTHERLERIMSLNFHRNVALGRATWSLGLNGLVLATDNLNVSDRIGKGAFITSDYAEIGVPLLPMLAGDFEPRSVMMVNPKLYAVQISKRTWNFSDLPSVEALRNVAYIDVKGAEVHIIDKANDPPAKWSPRMVRNAAFHLERPFQNRTWPFSISFEIPNKRYVTKALLTGIGNGSVHEWEKNNHQFDLKSTNINLEDFRDFFPTLPPISGLMNVEIHGEGIPQKNFNVNAVVRSPLMTVDTPGLGKLTFRNGVTSGQFSGNPDLFRWNNVLVQLGTFTMRSNGRMTNWQTKNPSYDGTVNASTNDINQLAKILPAQLLPRQILPPHMASRVANDRRRLINIEEALSPARLTGAVNINARFKGTGKNPSVWADINARNMSMASLAELRPFKDQPIIGILGTNPRAKLNIRMNVVPEGRSKISGGEIIMGRSRILFNGYIVPRENITHISYFSRNLNLAEVTPALRESAAQRRLNRVLGLPESTRLTLGGFLDVNGLIETRGEQTTIRAVSQLKNVSLTLSNGELRATKVNGRIVYDGNTLAFSNVRGFINNGGFSLDGSVASTPNGPVNIVYKGKSIDLAAVKSAARVMNVQSPLLTSKYLRGRIDDVTLIVNGTLNAPLVSMTGKPRDISFQPPGAAGAVRIAQGTFSVVNNQVFFQDVRGMIGQGTFVLSGSASGTSSNIAMTGTNIDISEFRRALIDLNVNAPVITGPQILFGRMRHAVLTVRTSGRQSQFSLSGSPTNVYYQPKGLPRTFILTGGHINVSNTLVVMKNLRGKSGDGTFALNGSINLTTGYSDIAFDGRNLDLSNVKAALQALNIKHPLLAQQLLYGQVHRLIFTMRGDNVKPKITLVAHPKNVYFEPHGSQRTVRLVSGVVTYKDDALTATNLGIVNARSRVLLSMRIENLSAKSRLDSLSVSTKDLDLADLSSYLAANSTPATLREKYQAILKQYGLSDVIGNIAGKLNYTAARNGRPMQLLADVHLKNIGFDLRGVSFAGINGIVRTQGNDLIAEGIRGHMENTPLNLNLVVQNVRSDHRTWSGEVISTIDLPQLLSMLPGDGRLAQLIRSTEDIPVRIGIFGNAQRTSLVFTGAISATSDFSVQAPIGLITKPENVPINVVGLMVYRPQQPTVLKFYNSHLDVGDTRLAWHGEYVWPVDVNDQPHIDFTFSLPRPTTARTLLALLPAPQLESFVQNITGRVGGEMRLTGPLNSPATRGKVDLYDVSIPALNITSITGSIEAPEFFATRQAPTTAYLTGPVSEAFLRIQRLKAGKITFCDIHGTIRSEQTPEGQRMTLDNVVANLYGGTTTLNGSVTLNDARPFSIDAVLANVNVDRLATEAFGADGEVTGSLSAIASVSGEAGYRERLLQSLNGNGRFSITDGQITRLGDLQDALQGLNLLQEGILGLNLNNILAALSQVENGEFNSFSGNFGIANSIVHLNQVSFIGDELRFRAQGALSLITKEAELQVAGNIPRVAKGILKGPLGGLLQHLSINNILRAATFGLLDEMPDIPILGRLSGGHKPRAFEFIASGNLNDPDSFKQSIMKTFKWLPNAPDATPHPVFGVGAAPEAIPQ